MEYPVNPGGEVNPNLEKILDLGRGFVDRTAHWTPISTLCFRVLPRSQPLLICMGPWPKATFSAAKKLQWPIHKLLIWKSQPYTKQTVPKQWQRIETVIVCVSSLHQHSSSSSHRELKHMVREQTRGSCFSRLCDEYFIRMKRSCYVASEWEEWDGMKCHEKHWGGA